MQSQVKLFMLIVVIILWVFSIYLEREENNMKDEEIFEKVKSIVVNQLGIEENNVKMEATFVDDLSADSLDIVELIMGIEEEFDLEIPDSDAERIVTVGDVVEYIKAKK